MSALDDARKPFLNHVGINSYDWIKQCVQLDAVRKLQFTEAELREIDRYAQEGAIDLWKGAREGAE
jgi:hypothetical protein